MDIKNPSAYGCKQTDFCALRHKILELGSYLIDTIYQVLIHMICVAECHSEVTMTNDLNDIQVFRTCAEKVVNAAIAKRVQLILFGQLQCVTHSIPDDCV